MHNRYIENAEEKLEAAEYLLQGGFYNDAASRAYYSMFYAAKALLSLKEIYPKAHAGVVSQFGLQFVSEGLIEEWYAKSLAKAQTSREKADYDIEKDKERVGVLKVWKP